jgi:uncharacterized protein involved in response to NO
MTRLNLFDYGFRPFFLLAGIYAGVVIPAWMYLFSGHATMSGALPAMYWHAHEMLYGFVVAAIAGFLLTAVPSWTGARGFAGGPLVLAVAAWTVGRLVMAAAGHLPFWLVAAGELLFLPVLASLLAPPLLRSRNRNLAMLVVIAVLWLIDAVFVAALARQDGLSMGRAMTLAIDVVLVLVTVIGGRIVPAFTANALRRSQETVVVRSRTWVEVLTIGATIAIVIADLLAPAGAWTAVIAALAAVAHAIRLSGWRSFKTRGESILWVLHVGYAWLPVGLALKACYLLGLAPWAAKWQHALTIGLFGTMILAVMTRASLGHTGRPLVVSRVITAAYLLLTACALIRVFGGAILPAHYLPVVFASAGLWVLAFVLYLWVYTPILTGPRADGKTG